MEIVVGSRKSPLAQIQVQEVLGEIKQFHPSIEFKTLFLESTGDKDQKTSLRTLDKTDFFTKEIDEMLLKGQCRIGIHSAKDLPEPLPEGLAMVALTKGIDPSDSLVMRFGITFDKLPQGAVIATSSERREEAVQQLKPDHSFKFVDLRGTIGQRISLLEKGEADGVVVAEAALIRLGLTHVNRVRLPGDTTPMQGQLAIIAREDDIEMRDLFTTIDSRKLSLFTGLEVPAKYKLKKLVHCPLIEIQPVSTNALKPILENVEQYTHFIFTSKTAVDLFFDIIPSDRVVSKKFFCVGKATAKRLISKGVEHVEIAKEETAEGVVELLKNMQLNKATCSVLWPHAAGARNVISHWLQEQSVNYQEIVLYETLTRKIDNLPSLESFEEVIFSSPSTVEAFKELYGDLPRYKTLTAIGPITHQTYL